MKHNLFERFVAMVLAFTLVMSTGVLDSAGWLIAKAVAQDETITESLDKEKGSTVVSDADGVVITLEEEKTGNTPAAPEAQVDKENKSTDTQVQSGTSAKGL